MSSTPVYLCVASLSAMLGAGVSHFWSVQSFSSQFSQENPPVFFLPSLPSLPAPAPQPVAPKAAAPAPKTKPAAPQPLASAPVPMNSSQQEFFNTLLTELKQIKNENQDLRDLMGETNRDVMKLAFRVDTHSESFRPLPAAEDNSNTSLALPDDDLPGVLPPRAKPVRE